ncbi:sporulation integral membrane protein YlbJ [Tissierella praeacuta]|uniref:sporulation integral membrane protein YlbJ n=1 Tax=Tissierella praeacuta TaxID=43131 RepID=UPI00333ECC1B
MKTIKRYRKFNSKTLFLIVIIIVLVGIIANPKLSLKSAASGITIWFNIVLPSLLPFFIISEILIGLGFVDFVGKLLQPLMKPLFNMPGESAFPLTMSLLSGYPVGAKITSRLREERLITKNEANRLICFTSTSGPLFMLGAVSIGMLNDPKIAPLIIAPHYLSVLILGLFFSFYKSGNRRFLPMEKRNILKEIQESYIIWTKTKKPLGPLITKSVKESMDTIILIGGLVIFYSVLVEILFSMKLLDRLLYSLSNLLNLDSQLIKGTIIGFFEMTIGCKNIAISNASLISKILVINFVIGWSGFSVHSQALSFINNTDINSRLYILAKFFHGILSSILGYILYLLKYQEYVQTTFYNPIPFNIQFNFHNWISLLTSSAKLVLTLSIYMFLSSIIVSSIYRIFKRLS